MNLDPKNIKAGEEQYEEYFSPSLNKMMIHYDFRDNRGVFFTCVTDTLEQARELRNEWRRARKVKR